MIIVINKKSTFRPQGHYYYVGRPSPLGNPFKIGSDGGRKAVIDRYKVWLAERLKKPDSQQSREIEKLCRIAGERDLVLVCWCTPLPCHAEWIRAIIESRIN